MIAKLQGAKLPRMNYRFEVFPAERVAVVQWFGRVTFDDVIAWINVLAATPNFSPDFDGIVDLRKADLAQMTPAQVKAIAQHMVDKQLTRGKWVHLASGPAETALSMMYAHAVSEQYQTRVFSTVESAAEYLGRDSATLSRVTKL